MEEKKPQGVLFDSIPYYSLQDFSNLVDTLTTPQSLFILNKSVEHAYKMGVFTLLESEVVSKCLRQINSHLVDESPLESK